MEQRNIKQCHSGFPVYRPNFKPDSFRIQDKTVSGYTNFLDDDDDKNVVDDDDDDNIWWWL